MFIFKHGSRRVALHPRATNCVASITSRTYASRIDIPIAPPPFPVVEACPLPTCQCQEMPAGLDIERENALSGTMASYAEQVLICTGCSDWKSKIEDEEDAVLVKQLKRLLGRGGKYSDPYHNVMLTNSSFAPTKSSQSQKETSREPSIKDPWRTIARSGSIDPRQADVTTSPTSTFLLPSFQYVPTIPTDASSVEAFIKAFILPSQLHQSHDRLTRAEKNVLMRQPEGQRGFVGARKINEILVLICGHGGRDVRCGSLGPILKAEFEEKLQRQNVTLLRDPPVPEAIEVNTEVEGYTPTARVGLISHIGGHKWAGNVIIYIPPSFGQNSLAGRGIWYGRVGPEHVEGIVEKTVLGGKVIKELFRGGIDQNREIMRL